MRQSYWVPCPKCNYQHFIKLHKDTVLMNYPAYCKGCKQEINISTRAREPKLESVI